MKTILIIMTIAVSFAFNTPAQHQTLTETTTITVVDASSFKLVNDTKSKVSIHTGSGFVSLNKGGSTSISCNTGKEVRWAEKGKKKDVIFKIASDHCGKTIKLSKFL